MFADDAILVFDSPVGLIALSMDAAQAARLAAENLLGVSTPAEKTAAKGHTVPLMDAGSIATVFGMDAAWFLSRARENRIPYVRIGKYVRFDPDEIRSFFHRNPDRHANLEGTDPQQHRDLER